MASNNNYYEFRVAKVAIAIELAKRGWEIFGFKEDESDSMTDYWNPADWDGIATKNGYVVVIDCSEWRQKHLSGRKQYSRSDSGNVILSVEIQNKIRKLQEVRQDRGASPAEEATAKKKIEVLMNKASENRCTTIKIEKHYPVFQPNPGRCSWHVEKDGIIVAKGNGVAKFSCMERYNKDDEAYYKRCLKECAPESYNYKHAKEVLDIAKKFAIFINKIDTAAGAMLSKDGKGFVYETIVKTEYKIENKAVECAGSMKEGQCFIIKSDYTYCGVSKGMVYRIHERNYDGKTYFTAVRLNGKLTKELTGYANSANHVFSVVSSDKYFEKWLNEGKIAWCEIHEVKTPYEVTKVVKKR